MKGSFDPTSHLKLADTQVDFPLNHQSFRCVSIKCSKMGLSCWGCFIFIGCGSFPVWRTSISGGSWLGTLFPFQDGTLFSKQGCLHSCKLLNSLHVSQESLLDIASELELPLQPLRKAFQIISLRPRVDGLALHYLGSGQILDLCVRALGWVARNSSHRSGAVSI